jgi:hypothetical protein
MASEDAMAGMTKMEIKKLVNRYIGVSGGYLGDFSYRTHADFYPEYCGLDIDPYQYEGTTRIRFETILEKSPPYVQAKIVRGVLDRFPPKDGDLAMAKLRDEFLELASKVEASTGVEFSTMVITSGVVERAISDAETLLRSHGATSSVDRIHTALHGYLRALCDDSFIVYEDGSTMAALFKKLRSEHPAFKEAGPRAQDINHVMRAMCAIMDSLNPLRNNASVAHANAALLDEPEAMLVINAARTILNYLDAKLATYKDMFVKEKASVLVDRHDDIPF